MKPSDLNDAAIGSDLTTDVCVIGSGPAGAIVALELAEAGIDVMIVESGGWDLEPETNELYELDNVGLPRIPQDEIRVRQFGGSATRWTGRVAPFRAIDFAERPWVPMSGWPFTPAELEPHLGRAATYLGLAAVPYDGSVWRTFDGRPPARSLDSRKLVDEIWQFSNGIAAGQPVRVEIDMRERIERNPRLEVLLHANVLEVVPTDNGRQVDHVVVSTLEGKRATVSARSVVICAGGIESSRLLLASRSVVPTGLGNDRDLVGRYYMEHPYAEVATFSVEDDWNTLLSRFGTHWYSGRGDKQVFMSGLALSPRVQRERELLNACMYVLSEDDEMSAIHAARRLATGTGDTGADVRALLSRPMELAEAARRRQLDGLPPIVPPTRIFLGVNAEQRPDPDSRITLSDRTDRLGVPLTRMDWRMDDQEMETVRTMVGLVTEEFERLGLPQPQVAPWLEDDDWRDHFVDTAHHSSGVRMATDPSRGVTDPWGHVYGVDGLFVAGSALFPTVGTANPTLMLASVALRVADAVRDRHSGRPPAPDGSPALLPAAPKGPRRIGLIGSGHRMRTVYKPVLDALGDEVTVVGVTSRSAEGQASASETFGTDAFASPVALLDGATPDALIVAVSDDANVQTAHDLLGCGRPVLFETPWSWGVAEGRELLQGVLDNTSIGVAEQFPFLPMEQLRAQIIDAGVIGPVRAVHNESYAWSYHGMALSRRFLSPLAAAESVQANRSLLALVNEAGDEIECGLLNAAVRFSDGSTMSYRFIDNYDPDLRVNQRLTIDGAVGSITGPDLRFLDPAGQLVQTTLRRVTDGDTLVAVEADCGEAWGTFRWEPQVPATGLTDEQIAVAQHVRAIAGSADGSSTPLYPPSEAMQDVELVAAMDASSRHGGAVRLPMRLRIEQARRIASAAPDMAKGAASRVTRRRGT